MSEKVALSLEAPDGYMTQNEDGTPTLQTQALAGSVQQLLGVLRTLGPKEKGWVIELATSGITAGKEQLPHWMVRVMKVKDVDIVKNEVRRVSER